MTVEKLMTTDEVAEVCRTSASTVRFWRQCGRGPRSFKVGRRVLYAEADVRLWIESASSDASA